MDVISPSLCFCHKHIRHGSSKEKDRVQIIIRFNITLKKERKQKKKNRQIIETIEIPYPYSRFNYMYHDDPPFRMVALIDILMATSHECVNYFKDLKIFL